jgi:hypothetical protein
MLVPRRGQQVAQFQPVGVHVLECHLSWPISRQ